MFLFVDSEKKKEEQSLHCAQARRVSRVVFLIHALDPLPEIHFGI
jgi:hypothetical protein